MNKKILVAIDDSENAMRAVESIGTFFTSDANITLFNVSQDTEALCRMNSPELTPYFLAQQSSFCAIEEKKRELVTTSMEKARKVLVETGFSEKNIELKTVPKKHGVARDIIHEAAGGYDLIVIGRRGVTGVKDFLLGNVSQKVFNSVKSVSIMVIN